MHNGMVEACARLAKLCGRICRNHASIGNNGMSNRCGWANLGPSIVLSNSSILASMPAPESRTKVYGE